MAKGRVGVEAAVRAQAGAATPRRPAPQWPGTLTPFHQRLAAEMVSAGGGSGAARLAPALARAEVDLNPHQVEAAAFALSALPTGGAVLADEVGLGKTVEAGLVMAQLAAEGRGRAVVLVPATLRSQWRDELLGKFGIEATVLDGPAARAAVRAGSKNPFDTGGVVIASHSFAAQRADELARVPWDLAVVDEAHRLRNGWRRDHRTGQALRRGLRRCPKLLLTATPLQNELTELLGLTSLIDETLLGSEESFRHQYGGEPDQARAADLRERLSGVVVRTLRRQVKEYVKFTARRSMVEDFTPGPEEQELYDRVSAWLRREDSQAFPPGRRALLVLVYRKILASSSSALAAALSRLAQTLEARLAGAESAAAAQAELGPGDGDLSAFEEEAEEWNEEGRPAPRGGQGSLAGLRAEVAELRACARLAASIRTGAKGGALLRGLERAFTVSRACGWPEKAVLFTEFRATQDWLRGLLQARGYSVTCLSGDSGGPDQRMALVEEFRERSQVLLMTEAGAEGLNLQFCNLVVNFDLPWNPQRLEQRIGRCHRYGQARDVLVVNFLNLGNAADARLYELLASKLALFDGVFGASDEVLGALGSGIDFERRVLDIYQSCRSGEEIDRAFDALRADLDGRIEARLAAARALLFERFDGEVRARLRLAEQEARDALARREADEEALLRSVYAGEAAAQAGPGRGGRVRRSLLAREAAAAVRARPAEAAALLDLDAAALPAGLAQLAGREGWWFVYRFAFDGPCPEVRVAHLVLWSDGQRYRDLAPEAAEAVARLPAREARGAARSQALPVSGPQQEALARLEARLAAEVGARAGAAFDEARERWDRSVEDALLAPRRAADEARAAWERARQALHQRSELPPRDRRALLERAERESRRRLEELRASEVLRYGEKDRALLELRRRVEARPRRSLVATAYWRCGS